MIRIIESITVSSLDRGYKGVLPLVPASARAEVEDSSGAAGRLRSVSVTAAVKEAVPALMDRLAVTLAYCDGGVETYGTADLPFHFTVTSKGGQVTLSGKYDTPLY